MANGSGVNLLAELFFHFADPFLDVTCALLQHAFGLHLTVADQLARLSFKVPAARSLMLPATTEPVPGWVTFS